MSKVSSQDYRDAMACLGAAVNIVTTDGRAGRAGFTASAVCSVTDDPPTLLVCMSRGGGIPVDERFAAAVWSTLETGAPVLAEGAAAFDCRIIDVANVGTHDVLFCRVVALQRSDSADNLIYFGRDYHVVPAGLA